MVYEIDRSLAAELPDFITDQDITVLKRRAASAKLKLQAQLVKETPKEEN